MKNIKIKIIVKFIKVFFLIFIINTAFANDYDVYNRKEFLKSEFINKYLGEAQIRVITDDHALTLVLPSDMYVNPDMSVNLKQCKVLDFIAKLLKEVDFANDNDVTQVIEVNGHSDDIGYPADQEKRTYLQAKVIADYLVARGVQPSKIVKLAGEGSRYPLAKNKNLVSRYMNRRVEISIIF